MLPVNRKALSFDSGCDQTTDVYNHCCRLPYRYASEYLRQDPSFTQILGKKSLTSQPTISRCLNHFDIKMMEALDQLLLDFVEKAYTVSQPEYVVLDVDTAYIDTHG